MREPRKKKKKIRKKQQQKKKHTNGGEGLLEVTRGLSGDGEDEVLALELEVLLVDGPELGKGPGDEHLVEGGLVGAPVGLAGLVDGLGVGGGLGEVDGLVLVAAALDEGDEDPLEVAGGVADDVVLEGLALDLVVLLLDGLDLGVAPGGQDLDQAVLVGAGAGNGVVEGPRVVLGAGPEPAQEGVLEVVAGLRPDVVVQVAAKGDLVLAAGLDQLVRGPGADDGNQGLVIGA